MSPSGYLALIGLSVCLGTIFAASNHQESERIIRSMIDQAIGRLNRGDITAFEDFWDEGADYVSVDGRLINGRPQIQAFYREMAKSSAGQPQQAVSVEQIRFITSDLATVDGSWTVTGARAADGKELAPIKGRGFEVVQKKNGKWRFIVTREMVVFKGQ